MSSPKSVVVPKEEVSQEILKVLSDNGLVITEKTVFREKLPHKQQLSDLSITEIRKKLVSRFGEEALLPAPGASKDELIASIARLEKDEINLENKRKKQRLTVEINLYKELTGLEDQVSLVASQVSAISDKLDVLLAKQ